MLGCHFLEDWIDKNVLVFCFFFLQRSQWGKSWCWQISALIFTIFFNGCLPSHHQLGNNAVLRLELKPGSYILITNNNSPFGHSTVIPLTYLFLHANIYYGMLFIWFNLLVIEMNPHQNSLGSCCLGGAGWGQPRSLDLIPGLNSPKVWKCW